MFSHSFKLHGLVKRIAFSGILIYEGFFSLPSVKADNFAWIRFSAEKTYEKEE